MSEQDAIDFSASARRTIRMEADAVAALEDAGLVEDEGAIRLGGVVDDGSQPESGSDHRHGDDDALGVLVVNLGTPDEPTTAAVRRYLAEFLWDPRIVELPRPLWWLILNGVILNIRPRRSAKAYASVWTNEGSPLLAISRRGRYKVGGSEGSRLSS